MERVKSIIEHGLVYIGYVVGILLFLENLSKIIDTSNVQVAETGQNILFLSVGLWCASIISRRLFKQRNPNLTLSQKVKIEFLYFLFCHTFVLLFITNILRYTPVSFAPQTINPETYQNYSQFLNYASREFAFTFLINVSVVMLFLAALLLISKLIYMYTLSQSKYLTVSDSKMSVAHMLTIAFMFLFSFMVINIPFVSKVTGALNSQVITYLKGNFQWLIDYVLGSPILYYIYASFRGSELAEKFSLYRKYI